MLVELLNMLLGGFVIFFGVVSSLIIIFGGMQAVIKIILIEVFKRSYNYEVVRKELTDKIIFGLEILIIADIIETLKKPDLEELLLVGAIVIIRTILSYFLSKEAEEGSLSQPKNKFEA
ncbi:MAG: DUF1622 domain-containing protein [Methanosarcina sp.]